ncbi:hemagglutinin repeat-containing protein [Paraburkholderia sp. BL17N1]|uniref:hemagglutinin repeat-containing protein n=1 Tax=Paraburkholderia sp. BL17N1 TaxID=1938798 RepID=UPI000EABB765|nr:hemagglutinin repeat-containing protein [Paraburkholderia sp. BL17N1]RKR45363.1 filamentous hemagglutinin [Paraburkholderia sp. BL17N1]
MNRNNYRLVFSRLRNMLVAVEETATTTAKENGQTKAFSHGNPAGHTALFTLRQIAFAALALLGALPSWSAAQIVPGGAHAPSVIQAPNGVGQVNINRPSGAGVSVNTYNQFDVQQRGAILNNSPTMVQSQLGGMINGNPNFAPGQAAKVIVNQVNSASASQFNGALEVAGQRANVILASPSGISVNGGTFINTSRATLTTGTPNYAADGSVSGFNVTGGNIAISGAGLNASNVDQVDLPSRAVQANAAVYAKTNLNVVTGANSVDYNTLNATPIAGNGPAPGVSIDVSNLGGMYANRIQLVGTELGVGVSLKGIAAAQSGDLVLTSAGRLVLAGQTNASGNIIANAPDIDNTGTTYAQQNVSLTTSGALTNSGVVAAQQNTTASAGSVSSTGTLAAGVNGDGSLAQSGDLNVNASGAVMATGRNVAGGNARISGASANLAGATNSANGALALAANSGDLNLSGATTTAGGTLDTRASGTLTNDNGAMSSGGAQTITAGALSNRSGQIVAGSTLTENVSGATNNQGGTMQAAGALASSSGTLNNSGGTIASLNADGVSISTTGLLNNGAGGSIGGNGAVTLQGAQIANAGSITAVQSLIARAVQALFNSGTLATNADMTLSAGTTLTNAGQFGATRVLALSAATFDNSSGTASASQFTLHAANLLNRGGTITQTGTGATTLDVTGTLDNSAGGKLQTNSTDLTIAPATLDNDGGTITHAGTGKLSINAGNGAGAISNVGGRIATNGQGLIQGGALNNASGSIIGQNGLTATFGGALDNTNGKLLSNTDKSIASGTLNNNGGPIGAGTKETISTGTLTNSGGSIVAPDLTLTTGATLDNSGGDIEANQLALKATDLLNRGGTITQYGTSSMGFTIGGTFDNSNGGTFQTSSTDLTLAPGALVNDGGSIIDAGTGTLTIAPGNGAGNFSNVGGKIIAAGQIAARAASLNNANGVLAAHGNIAANIAGDLNNTQGSVRSLSSLSLASGGALTNTNGQIQSGTGAAGDVSTLGIQASSVNNTNGLVGNLGSGDMTVQGGSQTVNSGGVITGNGNVAVNTSSLVNTQNGQRGGQISGAGVTVQGDTVDNSGGQIGTFAGSNGDVSITTTGALTNANGQIGATHNLAVTAATLTGGGAYSAANDVAVSVQRDFAPTPDVQFNAGHDLSFTLPGTFSNNALVQAANNLNINAGDVQNSGVMMAGGTLATHSNTLKNTGTLVGGSVALNATQSLSNTGPTALIGATDSNGTLELLSNDIENRDDTTATDTQATTAIYGLGKVVLAGGKNADGSYTNAGLIRNQSALIESAGDMELHAAQVTNTRTTMTTTGLNQPVDPALLEQLGISLSGCTAVTMAACSGQNVGWSNATPDMIGGVNTDPPHGGQWNSGYQYTTYTGAAVANLIAGISPQGQIIAGGNLDASSVGLLQNYWSAVAAVGSIAATVSLDQNSWQGQAAPGVQVTYSGYYHYTNYDHSIADWTLPFGNAPFTGSTPGGYTQAAPADIRNYALPSHESSFVAGGTLSGNGISIDNTAGNAGIPSLGLAPGQAMSGVNINGISGNASGGKSGAASVNGGSSTVDPAIASATAQNVLQNLSVPQGGLFHPTTAPGATYLIETNPAFTNQKTFLSSDYYLQQLGLNPQTTEKRLGDGFYEQQIVRNQITSLTGKAVLGPYTDLQGMYQSLLEAGASLSKSLDLPLGMSLSPEQVAALTSNVVIMQTEIVNGQQVLVPVVYLAKASQQNMNGPLIAATDIDIRNAQTFTNSGTVQAGNALSIQGNQISNAFGTLQSGGLMSLTTKGNVDLTSATVNAGSLALNAGGDLLLNTAVKTVDQVSATGATRTTTTLGPIANLNVAGNAAIVTGGNFEQNAGNLNVGGNLGMAVGGNYDIGSVQTGEHKVVERANGVSNTDINQTNGSSIKVGGMSVIGVGGDLTATGANINLAGGGTLAANGNVTLQAEKATPTTDSNSSGSDSHGSYSESLHRSDDTLTATTLNAGNSLTVASGKDISVTGSAITLDKGTATLAAVGNVNIGAATETHVDNSQEQHKHSNVVSGKEVSSSSNTTATLSQGSMVSADAISIASGKDINVAGSTIVGTNDVNLAAAGNVNITTSQDTQTSKSSYSERSTGFDAGGGIGISYGTVAQTNTANDAIVTNNASTAGSLNGSVNIVAGNDLHVTGSDLIAAKNVTGTGANVIIDSATDTYQHDDRQAVSKSGFTLAIKAPVIDAISNTVDQARAASHSQDDRAAALHGMAAASSAIDALGAGGAAAGKLASGQPTDAKIELSYGSSHSENTYSESSTTNRGSNVTAGGTAAFVATGNGTAGSGNVTIAGSNVNANDVILAAKNQVNLVNTTDTDSTSSTNRSSSASVGISYGTQGWGVDASASKAKGDGNSDAAMQNNTHVSAANTATIISGGDTNIAGSNVSGRQVNADVGGNLTIASVQDTMHSDAHQESTGGGFSISQGGGSASFSHTNANASGSYAGVNEQAGIQAGDGGFNVNVKGNTDLKGATIASTADAANNNLSTGTLTFSDIQNSSSYNAHSGGIGGGVTLGDGGSNYATHGSTSGTNTGGVAPMLSQNDSGSDSAATRSAISAGTISVTDAAHQTQAVASLSRDTTNTNGTVAKLPDVNNLLDRQSDMMAAASAAGEAVSRRVGDFAQSKYDEAKANGDQAGMDAWKEGGIARADMQAAGAAIVTGLAGGNAVGGAAGAAIASIAAGKLNELGGAIAGANPTGSGDVNTALGNIVANAIATGAGGAIGGNAGAVSGYNVDRFNRQLHPDERQFAKDNASKFAQFYKDQTGQTITADQAQQMLLASGYRLVDAAAGAGPAPDGSRYATAFISQNAGNMFRATTAEYNSPFLYGNGDHSLSPEQKALPGAVASPKTGLAIAAGLATAGFAPEIAAGIASIPGTPVFGSTGALGSGTLASPLGIAAITGGVNATSQYIQNGTINLVDVGYAALAAGAGTYTKLIGNVAINAVTGALDTVTNNAISGKHDSVATGAAVNAGASAIGYGIGLAVQNSLAGLSKVATNSFNWSGTDVWAGSSGQNLFIPNNLPVIGSGTFGAAGSEAGTKAINDAKARIGK